MSFKRYGNFVRPASPSEGTVQAVQSALSGEEAKKLYLEEVQDIKESFPTSSDVYLTTEDNRIRVTPKTRDIDNLSNNDLFLSAQNNDVNTLRLILDKNPDKINAVDDYGWSLLMIACQANSTETVKELLKRKIDMYIRDKAGNSAQSLVIKSKNLVLADLLLSHRSVHTAKLVRKSKHKKNILNKEQFACEVCNKTFPDKEDHLSSTIHNINASKGRKLPTNYVIPESNRGYQIMLRVGWDKESGLGPDGMGHKYPIRTVQKKDRKGLGMEKKKKEEKAKQETNINRRILERDYHRHKRMEVNFRREFY